MGGPTTSRRGLIGSAVSALIAGAAIATATHGAPVAVPAASGDDAELLTLCARFHRLHEDMLALAEDPSDPNGDALSDALGSRWQVSDLIKTMPAQSEVGRRAKAAIAVVLLHENGAEEDNCDGDKQFAYATLLETAGKAPLPRQDAVGGVDADLIALCTRLVAIDAEYRAIYAAHDNPKVDADEDPRTKARMAAMHEEWMQIADRIYDLPDPVTPAGVRAVARAAYAEAEKSPDGRLHTNDLATWLALTVVAWHTGSAAA